MISIRNATPGDLQVLIQFQLALAHETENMQLNELTLRKGIQAILEDQSKGLYYVAEIDGIPVGCYMVTYEWSEWRNGVVYWLQSVYVDGASRGKGVFKKMYENLCNTVQNNPRALGIRLYANKANLNARKVYESLGMDGDHNVLYEWMKSDV